MQTEIFLGGWEGLKVRLDVIILSGRVINQVVKVSGGTYLILHT